MIPTVSLAAQENQQIMLNSSCQERPVPVTPAPRAHGEERRLCSSCPILHLARLPEGILPIFSIIFSLHNSGKGGRPEEPGARPEEPGQSRGQCGTDRLSRQSSREILPRPPGCCKQPAGSPISPIYFLIRHYSIESDGY